MSRDCPVDSTGRQARQARQDQYQSERGTAPRATGRSEARHMTKPHSTPKPDSCRSERCPRSCQRSRSRSDAEGALDRFRAPFTIRQRVWADQHRTGIRWCRPPWSDSYRSRRWGARRWLTWMCGALSPPAPRHSAISCRSSAASSSPAAAGSSAQAAAWSGARGPRNAARCSAAPRPTTGRCTTSRRFSNHPRRPRASRADDFCWTTGGELVRFASTVRVGTSIG